MDDMIERVARALAKADGKDPDDFAWVQFAGGKPYGLCWRDRYSDKARAAIEAMREPTLAGRAYSAWQAMIDASLSPVEPTPEEQK